MPTKDHSKTAHQNRTGKTHHHAYQMLYRDWLTLSTHLMWCYDHESIPHTRDKVHGVSVDAGYTRAWLVRKGKAEVLHHDRDVVATPGQWIILDGEPDRRVIHPGTHLLSVAFVCTWPDGTSLFGAGLPLVVNAADYPKQESKLNKIARTMRIPQHAYTIIEQPMDYRTNLMLQRDLNDWLMVFLDVLLDHNIAPAGHYSYDPRVMQAVRLIDAAPLGKPLDLQAIAEASGLSPVHITRIFATEMHMTPRAYFEKRRIQHAMRYLSVSDAQIKEIAFSLGFRDLSHFNKWFRKHTKCAPREYAQNVLGLP
jgi:AraC-like DNA-binding protein